MAKVIGTVAKISGMAIVVDANGNKHMLKKGEALHVGDKIITASGASVLVKLPNGDTVNFAEAQTVKLTENLAQANNVDVTENAVDQAIFETVLTALNEGRDITQVLQDPAAGIAGSDGNATFVNLDRIETENAALSTYDSNGAAGGGDASGGPVQNLVFLVPAGDAPIVSLLGDADNNGYLNAAELNGGSTTTARVSFPVGVEPGDTVNVTHNGGTITVVISAADIAKGFVNVPIPVPAEGATLLVTATVTNQSGQTSPPGSDSAIIDTTSPNEAAISGQLPETKVDDTGASQTDNITSNTAPTLTGTTEKATDTVVVTVNGKEYTATVTNDGGGKGVWSVALTGANLSDGTYTPTIKVTDLAGNSTTKASETFTVDATAPDAASISGQLPETKVDDTGISQIDNITKNKAPTLTGTTEKPTDTVVVTVNGVDYTATVTNDGTGKGVWSVPLTGANLTDGEYTPSIKVTDLAGNTTTIKSETFTVDNTAPNTPAFIGKDSVGPIIGQIVDKSTIDDNLPEITGTGATPGDTITVYSNDAPIGTTVVQKDGTWTFTPPKALPDGDYVIKITATDPAGNESPKSDPLTFTVDATAPVTSISIDATVAGDGVVNLAESTSNNVPVTGTVGGDAKVGDVVIVTVNGKNYSTNVIKLADGKLGFSTGVAGADLVADQGRRVTAKITLTDVAGNSSTATDTQDYTVNTQGPAVSISLDATVAGDGVVNAAEAASNNVPVTGTVNGEFNVGDKVTVTVNGVDYTTTVLAGGKFSVDVKGSDLVADANKVVDAKVTTTDQFGNSTTATDSQAYAVNTQGPAVSISLDATVAGDGVVNAAEAASNNVPVTGTVNGEFNVGDKVTVTVNGVDYTTTVLAGGKFSVDVKGSDLVADANKVVDAKVTTTDQFGNSTTATDSQAYTVNTQGPAVSISLDATVAGDGVVNAAEAASNNVPVTGTVNGEFNVGDKVTVTVNGVDYITTVLAGGKFSVDVKGSDLVADANKVVDAKVTTTDQFGNSTTATDSQAYTVNTQGPAVSISLDATVAGDGVVNAAEAASNNVPVTGTVNGEFNVGDKVTVTVNGVDYITTVLAGGKFSVDVKGSDLVADANKVVDAKVTTTDQFGNSTTATDSQAYTVNTQGPAVSISLDATVAGDGVVNAAEAASNNVPVTGTVNGEFNVGDKVTVTVNGVDYITTVLAGGKFSVDVKGSDLVADANKVVDAKVTTTDQFGNSTTATDSQAYTVNTQGPAVSISLDATVAGDGVVNAAEAASNNVPVTGTVNGEFNVGDKVTVTVNGVDYTTTVLAGGKFSVDVKGSDLVADANKVVDAKVTTTDQFGNSSTATDTQEYKLATNPNLSATIALDANFGSDKDGIVNIAESQAGVKVPVSGTVGGDAKEGDAVVVTVNGTPYTTTVTKDSAGKLVFKVDVLGTDLVADGDKTIDAKVTVKDAANNTLTVNTALQYAVDLVPPSATIALDANFGSDKDGIVNIAESQAGVKVPVSGTVGGDAKEGDAVVVTVNGTPYTTTVTKDSAGKLVFKVDVLGTDLVADSDKTIDAKVTTTDLAGNTSTAVTALTYAVDLTPPSATIALDANFGSDKDGIVNIAESQAGVKVPVSGTVGGDAKEGDAVVVTVNGTPYTTTVTKDSAGKLVFKVDVLGTDLVADSDKTIDAKVTTTDLAGNTSTAVTALTYAVDLTPPSATIALDANFGSDKDGIVNIAESQAGVKVPVSGTVGGDAKEGDAVVVTVNGTPYTTTVTKDSAGKLVFKVDVLGTDLVADSDKTIDAKVTTTDLAGNTSTAVTALTYAVDLTPPSATIALDANFGSDKDGIVNIAESQAGVKVPVSGTVGGDAKEGDAVVVTVNGTPYTTTVTKDSAGKLVFKVDVLGTDLVADSDKTIDAKVTTTDLAGNTSTAVTALTYAVDLTPPSATIALDANFGSDKDGIVNIAESQAGVKVPVSGTVGGDAKEGDAVVVTVNGTPYTTTVTKDSAGKLVFKVDVLGTDLVADSDKTIDAKVTTTDLAGNTSTAITALQYSTDLTAPVPTISIDANMATDGIINIAESKEAAIAVTGTVGGDAKLNDPVIVTVNGKDYTTKVITRTDGKLGFSVNVPGSELAADQDRTLQAKVTSTDAAGNIASAEDDFNYVVDLVAPNQPSIDKIVDNFGPDQGNLLNGATADDATPTLVGKAEAFSTVTIFDTDKDGNKVEITKGLPPVTADKDGNWTFTPPANITKGEHNYTVVATDKAGNPSAPSANFEYNLSVVTIGDPNAGKNTVVSEEGLANGLKDSTGLPNDVTDSNTFSGDFKVTGATSVTLTAPTTTYTSGGATVTWTGNNTNTLIGTANGKEVLKVTIDNAGKYTMTLSAPVDHPAQGEDKLPIEFGVKASDGSNVSEVKITAVVEDDAPVATSQTITANSVIGSNIMLTIDVSGSMAIKDGINGTSRLQSTVDSINTLLDSYVGLGGDVRVMIVTFSDGSNQRTSSWVNVSEAKKVLEALKTESGTNYDAALSGSTTAFNSAGKIAGGQNVGYFFSDGEPNSGREVGNADRLIWETFLKDNDINQYAIGIGSGVSANQVANSMNQIAYNGATEVDTNAISVANFNQLSSVLSATVATPVTGSLITGGGFGADGGFVKTITLEGTTYTYNGKGGLTVSGATGNSYTFDVATNTLSVKGVDGTFVVDMDDGKYSYQAKSTTNFIGATIVADSVEMQQNDNTTWESAPVMTELADGRWMAVWYKNALNDNDKSMTVWGRIFNADGTASTNEFQVGKLAVDGDNSYDVPNLSINQLAGGNVVVQWVRSAGNVHGQDTPVFSIVNPSAGGLNPTPFIQDQVMRDTGTGIDSPAVVEALADGRFIAVWTRNGLHDNNKEMMLQAKIFNADGSVSKAQFQIGTWAVDGSDGYDASNWTVTQLANGNIVVGYIRSNAEAGGDEPVFTILNSKGDVVVQNVEMQQFDTTTWESPPVIEALADGRFIAIWVKDGLSDNQVSMTAQARIFNADGTPSTNEFQVGTFAVDGSDSYDVDNFTVKQLANGNIVVGYVRNTVEKGNDAPVFTVMDKNGNAIKIDVAIEQSENPHRHDSPPVIEALADGRFIAVWALNGTHDDRKGMTVMARVFNADGTPSTNEFQVGKSGVDGSDGYDVPSITVTQVANGNVIVGWQQNNQDGGGDEPIYSVIKIDPIATGSGKNTIDFTLSDSDGDISKGSLITNQGGLVFDSSAAKFGNILFQAYTPANGNEVWVSDGTTAGTKLLKDVYEGAGFGVLGYGNNWFKAEFTDLGNGYVLFQGYTPTRGAELWITDGTKDGTTLLKDINPGGGFSYAALDGFTSLGNGKIIFTAYTDANGRELWVTDGTNAGTYLVKDINAGPAYSFYGTTSDDYEYTGNFGADFVAIGDGKAIFQAYRPNEGYELWITDGTDAGTSLVKDIYAGHGSSLAHDFTLLGNGKVVFQAQTKENGYEIWVTDGTAAGTTLLKDIYTQINGVTNNALSSGPEAITATADGRALFWARDFENGEELWITDGTAAGTKLLKDINTGKGDAHWGVTDDITYIGNGKYIFSAYTADKGVEVWVTDLTSSGTRLLQDVNPGASSSVFYSSAVVNAKVDTNPYAFEKIAEGWALFSAFDKNNGAELWITNGVNAWLVSNVSFNGVTYDNWSSFPAEITALGNGNAIFSAYDYNKHSEPFIFNFNTWKTLHDAGLDTSSSVQLLSDINQHGNSYAQDYTVIGNGTEDVSYYLTANKLLAGWSSNGNGMLSIENAKADNASVVLLSDGRLFVTPDDNFNGELNITYDVVSSSGARGSASYTLNIEADSDLFKFTLADNGTAGNPTVKSISNFDISSLSENGDVLDVRDLLQGENASNLVNYLHFEKSGDDTIVHISSNGGFANGAFSASKETAQIVISGVDLLGGQVSDAAVISNLISQQKLITD